MKRFITILVVCCIGVSMVSCSKQRNRVTVEPVKEFFIRGADLSFLPEIEQRGIKFYTADGTEKDVLSQLSDNGCTTIRVRLWYAPENVKGSLSEVAGFCKRIKQHNLKVLLDLHYSDTWADPGSQNTPSAWKNLPLNTLSDSVYSYTRRVLSLIQPDYVQIGNEINGGFLWEEGRISREADFILLLKSGVKAARDYSPTIKIILHYAGLTGGSWFFGMLQKNTVDYDIMALSYYPVWHGTDMNLLQMTLQELVSLTAKEVMVVETAYPFTLQWNDYTNNIVGLDSQLVMGYPASRTGQLDFISALKNSLIQMPKGVGFCYWGGEWVAYKGVQATTGSSWENQALFDFNNLALPAMQVFNK
ncbi:MAG: glycoside hydrolase family 53 protein [Bacteroidales bacterium]